MATLQTTETRPGGNSHADGKAYFETGTNKMLVWDATASGWIELDSDGTGTVYQNRSGGDFRGANNVLDTGASFTETDGSGVIQNSFSIAGWLKVPSGSTPSNLGTSWAINQSSTNGRFSLRFSSGRFWAEYRMNSTTGTNTTTSLYSSGSNSSNPGNFTPDYTDWNHVAMTYSQGSGGLTISMYLNGELVDSHTDALMDITSQPHITSNIQKLVLGANKPSGQFYFGGLIDDVAIFPTVLTPSNLSFMRGGAATGIVGKPADLTTLNPAGWWRMGDDLNDSATSGGSIATITDSSGNGNDAAQSDVTKQPTFSDLTGETIYS